MYLLLCLQKASIVCILTESKPHPKSLELSPAVHSTLAGMYIIHVDSRYCSLNKKAPLKVGPIFKLDGSNWGSFSVVQHWPPLSHIKTAHWVLYENQQGIVLWAKDSRGVSTIFKNSLLYWNTVTWCCKYSEPFTAVTHVCPIRRMTSFHAESSTWKACSLLPRKVVDDIFDWILQ